MLGSGVDIVVITYQVEAVDAFGFTPAALAARAGHAEVAKQLGATAEAAAEVAAAAAAAKMLLVAPEECHAHMTHAAFVRSGPEPPPENDNRLTVLTHAAKCVSGLPPLRMVALDREGPCLSVCVLLQRRSSSSMEPQHVKTDSAQQKGWAGSRVLKSKLFQCGFAHSRARKDGTWIPRIDEELYTAVRRGLRPRVVGIAGAQGNFARDTAGGACDVGGAGCQGVPHGRHTACARLAIHQEGAGHVRAPGSAATTSGAFSVLTFAYQA